MIFLQVAPSRYQPNARVEDETRVLKKIGNSFISLPEGRKLQNIAHFQFELSIINSLFQRQMFSTNSVGDFSSDFKMGLCKVEGSPLR